MRICGLDIETTGFDHKNDHVTEIAWVIKDHGDDKPLVMKSYFVLPPPELWDSAEYIKPTITQLTKIEMRHVMAGRPLGEVLVELALDMHSNACVTVSAHNGEGFDKPFLSAKVDQLGNSFPVTVRETLFDKTLWLDTSVDVVYPEFCRQTNLLYLCAYHGFLNPFPHAALFDVMAMLKVLDNYPIDPVADRARSPWCFVQADVGYENRHLAKERRYYWETFGTKTFPKTWVKRIKEVDLEKERAGAPFKVHRIA